MNDSIWLERIDNSCNQIDDNCRLQILKKYEKWYDKRSTTTQRISDRMRIGEMMEANLVWLGRLPPPNSTQFILFYRLIGGSPWLYNTMSQNKRRLCISWLGRNALSIYTLLCTKGDLTLTIDRMWESMLHENELEWMAAKIGCGRASNVTQLWPTLHFQFGQLIIWWELKWR